MIAKEIENKKQSSSKAGRIGGLAKYITNPETENSLEKCTYSNAIGFMSRTQLGQIKEMIGVSQEAVRSKDTIKHYIFSWRECEYPSNTQVDDSVKILLKETGLNGHQTIYGLHEDTDNIHLHIMVNRVHPSTLKLVEINNGFDIEPIHKAVALIEHQQRWSREINGRYFVLENGDVCRSHVDVKKSRNPGQKQRDREYRTGEKSAQRIAIEIAAPIIKNAQSWDLLHSGLAQHGMSYKPAGKGAVIIISGVSVKASTLDPDTSFPRLQRRLGAYQPPMYTHEQSINVLQPLSTDVPGWEAYATKKNEHEEAKNKQNQMQQRHADEMQELINRQSNDRADIHAVDWVGKRDALNALRSVVAEDHAEAQKALRTQQKEELLQLSVSYPEWTEWKHSKKQSKAVSQPESKSRSTVEVDMDNPAETQNVTQEPSERQKQFERYSQALRADRYRITSTRVFKDGNREILILGDGEEGIRGYDAQELIKKDFAIQRIEKKSHILQYTPISAHKHHILIDKISHEGLDRLLNNGYKPAIVLKSEPDRFQVIITIPKSETPIDDQVGHLLTWFLNKEYGDPERKIIGAICPHVAPGSVVRLPENSNNVADTHVATLLKAEYCECAKTQSMAAIIREELRSKQGLGVDEPNLADEQVAKTELEGEKKVGTASFSFNLEKLVEVERTLEPETEKPKHSGPSAS